MMLAKLPVYIDIHVYLHTVHSPGENWITVRDKGLLLLGSHDGLLGEGGNDLSQGQQGFVYVSTFLHENQK